MMKKVWLTAILLAILSIFTLFSALPVFGASDEKILIRDNGAVLTDSEVRSLSEKLTKVSRDRECDIAVLIVPSMNDRDALRYAHQLYDRNGYGQGSGKDGILLLIGVEDREYAFSFNGFANDELTGAAKDLIEKKVKQALTKDDYAGAVDAFCAQCDYLLEMARNGESYNPFPWIIIPISLILGFVIALISVNSMKRKLTGVRLAGNATNYVRPNSLNLRDCRDLYLYSTVTRVARPKDSGSSGRSSSGGGRSGGSRGGRSGRF